MVYVDGLKRHPKEAYRDAQAARVGTRNSDQWCHLFADTGEELLAFAKKIGLRQKWLQVSLHGMPHYDLTPGRRVTAVDLGAQEISSKMVVKLIRKWREKGR